MHARPVVRLDSPPVARTHASSSPNRDGLADRPVRRLECAVAMDGQYFPMLFGSEEEGALNRFANLMGPAIDSAELAHLGAPLDHVEGIVGGWGMPALEEAILRRFPRLRVVFYAAGTIRGIATDAAWRRGIRFTTAALANAKPVAEFTHAAIILSLKRVWERSRSLRESNLYQRHQPAIPGCYGTTVGLLALGKVGRLVAHRLREMDVRVIGYDPFVPRAEAERLGVQLCSIEEVFATADVVSCHLPLHAATTRLLDAALFRRMKPDATFINTARGAVVHEPDLVDVLTERPDLYAVLDTIAEEPPPPRSALLRLPNAIVTPHIAGSMCHECRRMGIMMVDEVRRYVAGEPLLGEVREAELEILA